MIPLQAAQNTSAAAEGKKRRCTAPSRCCCLVRRLGQPQAHTAATGDPVSPLTAESISEKGREPSLAICGPQGEGSRMPRTAYINRSVALVGLTVSSRAAVLR